MWLFSRWLNLMGARDLVTHNQPTFYKHGLSLITRLAPSADSVLQSTRVVDIPNVSDMERMCNIGK